MQKSAVLLQMNSDSVLFVEPFYGCKHELISPAVLLIVLCSRVRKFSFDIYNSTCIAVSRSARHLLPHLHKAACALLCGESFSTSNGCWLFVLHLIKTFFFPLTSVSRKRRVRQHGTDVPTFYPPACVDAGEQICGSTL